MPQFKAYIKNGEIMLEGADEKIDYFTQFLDEMDEACDEAFCDCNSNDKAREVVEKYLPEYEDEIMALFEDNGGYCDCEVGKNAMAKNIVIKKLGHFMDLQDVE
ncbi:MAG: hypothetical protein QME45_08055 [Clostridiales bacterium]|nr:hypothetical protein [Clostridiales bacterium]HBM80495.1 hypothetical protein [Clostridiaceae bacterium]